MILQRLVEYYERKVALDPTAIAAFGLEKKDIAFIIVLDDTGIFVDLEDTRDGSREQRRGRQFTVPQSVKRASGVNANLLWDNAGYVLGIDGKGKPERARKQFEAFVHTIESLPPTVQADAGVAAVLAFLRAGESGQIAGHPSWPEIRDQGLNLSFRLRGDRGLVCQRPAVLAAVTSVGADAAESIRCMVTGQRDQVARLHPAIRGVRDAQSAGASLVSFNLDAFTSFGHAQGANAPVGERAVFAYTTALNHLLARGSRQRLQVGDATTVFWAERASPMEQMFVELFDPPGDDPDRNAEAVRALYAAPHAGAIAVDPEDSTPFYVLGLASNVSRLAIRYWQPCTVGQLVVSLRQYFDDLEIVRPPSEPPFLPLYRLLASTAPLGKIDNVRPTLAAEIMRAILLNAPFPRDVLATAVQRNRAEQNVTFVRASLIKAALVRQTRRSAKPSTHPEVGVSLDTSNSSVAYRLGRLFAVLERTQEEATPGLNATIRTRFFGAAATTPVTVFPHLMKLNNHHLAKLENRGRAVNLEKLIGSVIDGVNEFPALLSLQDQGRFSIGYYHQRQNFFTKREEQGISEPSDT